MLFLSLELREKKVTLHDIKLSGKDQQCKWKASQKDYKLNVSNCSKVH
jgi:hypothetical protein